MNNKTIKKDRKKRAKTNTNAGEDVVNQEPFYAVDGNAN
jgi:hypothetical protein